MAVLAPILTLQLTSIPTASAAVRQTFNPAVFNTQDNGAIVLIGNSQMTCPTSASGCTSAQTAPANTTTTTNAAIDNNAFNMGFIDADGSTAPGNLTTNSTSADLALPAGSTVLYARLIWGGRQVAGDGGGVAATGNLAQVKLRTPGQSTYTTVTGTVFDPNLTDTVDDRPYQGALDVTSAVQAAGNGTYWIGDIRAATGEDRYAGWSLIVAYRNPALPLRDLSVFEGFADVTTNTAADQSVTIPISGFRTPTSGSVNASVGFVAWEGDRGRVGEQARFNGVLLSDSTRPSGNFFNGSISDGGAAVTARNPNLPNAFGVDVGRVVANGVLGNSQTSTTLVLSTTSEFYYPTEVTTQIDLFAPAFSGVSKSVVNLSGHDPARAGDTLEYRISLTNTGLDPADSSVLTDVVPTNTTYVPGSMNLLANSGTPTNTGAKTDATGDDQGEYLAASRTVRMRVGSAASATLGGSIGINETVSMRYRVTVDRAASGTTIPNTASLAYVAHTIGKAFNYIGNEVDTPVAELANLAITKTSTPTTQTAGNSVRYTVTASNSGPNAATNVSVVDTLPAGVTFTSASAPAGTTCSATGQIVTCTAATLANGGTIPILIDVAIPPGTAAGTVVNQATITASTADDITTDNSASATTQITTSADVSVTKTAPAGSVTAGTNLAYTVTASNAGPSTAAATVLTDQVPAGTTFVSATSTVGTCAAASGTVTCAVGALAPGASAVATITVLVSPGYTPTSVTNTAAATSTTPDPTPGNNSSSVTRNVVTSADVSMTKTVSPNPAPAGSNVTYTMVVTNNGPSNAANIVVNDPAIAGLVLSTANSTSGTCTVIAGAMSCSVGSLSVNATATITLQGKVDQARAAGPLANTAAVTSDTPDPTPGNNSPTATLTVNASADVSITKTGPSSFVGGVPSSYAVTASNAGPSQATGVTISDTLPTGLTFLASTGCTAVGQVVTCAVGTLASGATATRTINVQAAVGIGSTVSNTATVATTTTDPNAANNTSTYVSSGSSSADVGVTKTTSSPLVAGGPITYTMVVSNNGPSPAGNVTLSDPLPPGITFVSVAVTGSPGSCGLNVTTVRCTFPTILPSATSTVTVQGTIGSSVLPSQTANTVTVASSSPADPTSSNNTATSTGSVTTSADVGVTLTPPAGPVVAGTTVAYQVHVVNNGPSDSANVVVTGQVPAGFVPVPGSSGGLCTVTGTTVTCNLGNLPVGAVRDFTLQATIQPDVAPGNVTGTALIGSPTPDTNPANDVSNATVQVVAVADLSTTKTVPSPLVAGAASTYTITVTNNGPSDATAVRMDDTLPAGLTPLAATPNTGTCAITGQAVACTTVRLPAGSSFTTAVSVTVGTGAPASITNTATGSSATTDPTPANNTATNTTPVVQQANLRVVKTSVPNPIRAGTSLSYTITLTNAGPSNATNVTLNDPLPSGLTIAPNGLSSTGNACVAAGANNSVSCTFGTVPVGDTRTVTVSALVPSIATSGATITNTATATSPTPDPTPATRVGSVSNTVSTEADVVVTKTPLNDSAVAGDTADYLISVRNNGPSVASAVRVSDAIPTGTTFVAAQTSFGTCDTAASGTLTCAVGSLAAGQIVTVQVTLTVGRDRADTTLVNTASAVSAPATGSPTPDPQPGNNTSSTSQFVGRRSDIRLTKAITSGPIVAGSNVVYHLNVSNNGPSDGKDVFISDPLPAGTTFVSVTATDGGTCVFTPAQAAVPPDPANPESSGTPATPATVRCTWSALTVGSAHAVDLTLAVDPAAVTGSTLANTANGGSIAVDPTNAPTATASGPVVTSADLSTTKTLLSGTPVAGGTVRWQVTVRNNGPSVATDAQVLDPAPSGITFSSATSTVGTCAVPATSVTCSFGTLAVGATATVTMVATLDQGYAASTLSNTASATSTTPDPNPANSTATSTTTVATSADLSITKTPASGTFVAGSAVSWTATVSNAGPSAATSVTVTDPIPAGVIAVNATVGATACSITTSINCAIGTLASGATATVTINGTLASDTTATSLANTATVASGTPDPDTSNNASTATSAVATSANLSIVKTGPATAAQGNDITWQITVRNAGPSVARGASITDFLPPDLLNPRVVVGTTPCSITAGQAVCQIGNVPVSDGTSATAIVATVTGTIDPASTATSMSNRATVDSPTADPTPTDDTAVLDTQLVPSADLAITKTTTPSPVVPGSNVTWTILVTNAGPSVARDVVVTDAVPAGVAIQSAVLFAPTGSTPCTVTGQAVSCAAGTVTPGVPSRIRIVGVLAQDVTAATLSNTAALTSSTPDPNTANNSATSTAPVAPSANVSIRKSVDTSAGLPVAGGPITFILDVANAGPSASQNATVSDVVPAAVDPATVVVTGPAGACSFDATSRRVSCALGTVAASATVRITVRGQLLAGADTVVNTADITTSTPDPDTSDNTSTATGVSSQLADLSVVKTGPASVIAGQRITWSIVVANAGPSNAAAVSVTDAIPAGLTAVTVTTSNPDLVCANAATVSCTIALLDANDNRTVTISALVPSSHDTSAVVNSASVTSSTPDPTGGNNTSTSTTPVAAQAGLTVTKSVDPSPLVAGRDGTYLVTVHNNGPSDAAATLAQDPLPAQLAPNGSVTTSQGSCAFTGPTLSCVLGVIPAGADATILIPVHVDPAAVVSQIGNTAQATSATPAPPAGPPPVATVTVPVLKFADLTLTKTGPANVIAGAPIVWNLTASNAGPSVAAGVVVNDQLPAGFGPVNATSSQGTCTRTGDVVSCAVGDVAPGAMTTIEITGTVTADSTATSLVNTAVVTSPTPEPDATVPDGRRASATTAVATSSDVSVTKSATTPTAVPGRTISWTIAASTSGPSVARNVVLAELLPTGVTNVTYAPPAGVTCDQAAATCTIPVLAVGAANTVSITISADVPANYAATTVANVVSVSTTTPDPDHGNDIASTTTPVAPQADLQITKTASPNPVVRGAGVTWTLTVTNAGPSVAGSVTVSDPVPAGVSAVTVTPPAGVTCTNAVSCTLGDVAPGAPLVITVSGTLAADFAGTTLANTAAVASATTPDPTPGNSSATSTSNVVSSADLSITKTGPTTAVAGNPVSWTITVTSTGPSLAPNTVVTDVAPPGVLGLVATTTRGTCTALVCALGTIVPGDVVTITVSGSVDPAFTGTTISNSATVASDVADPVPADDAATAPTVTVTRSADVSIAKTVSPTTIVPGTPATFTLAVTNFGPSTAPGVVVTDVLPAGMTPGAVTTTSGTCTVTAQTVSCALAVLAPTGSATVTVPVDVAEDFDGATFVNTATAVGTTPDADTASNSSTVSGPLAPTADLTVTKTADKSVVNIGDTLTWTVTVANAGPSTARNVVVTDALPAGVTVTGVQPAGGVGGACDPVSGTALTCRWTSLARRGRATVVITATVTSAAGPLTNGASVSSAALDPTPGDNATSVSTAVNVPPTANLSVTKVLTSGGTVPGGPATWTITAANAGPGTATAVVVTDPLPAVVSSVVATPSAGTCAVQPPTGSTGAIATCAVGDIAAGAQVTVTVSGVIDPNFRGQLTNTATATSPTADPAPADNSAASEAPVNGHFDLAIAKSVDRGQAQIGETVTFTVTVTNNGPAAADSVSVLESPPAGLVLTVARPFVGTYDATTAKWTIGHLAAGATVTMQIDAQVTVSGLQTNHVHVSGTGVAATEVLGIEAIGDTETRLDNNDADASVLGIAPVTPPGVLPATGIDTWAIVRTDLMVVAAGGLLLVLARRRRRRPRRS